MATEIGTVTAHIPSRDEHGHELFPLTDIQLAYLSADLHPQRIVQRKQGGSNLSYLEGYDVKAALTRIFGFGGWSAEILKADVLKINPYQNADGKDQFEVMAQAHMRLHIHQLGATYAEVAISSQKGAVVGDVADFAMKTAETDALKRCAINLGTHFGLSLYNKGATQDIVGTVVAPGQRAIDRDKMMLERKSKQLDTEKEMVGLAEQLQQQIEKRAEEANPATGELAGGQRHPEDAPEGIDAEAQAAAQETLASGFKAPEQGA